MRATGRHVTRWEAAKSKFFYFLFSAAVTKTGGWTIPLKGNADLLTRAQFPRSWLLFFFVYVPTALLEERARALDKLYGEQSAAQYVEYFEALEKLLANYYTTIRTSAAIPASRCSCCGRAPRFRLEGAAAPAWCAGKAKVWGINPDACAWLASMLSLAAGQREEWGIRTHNWLRYIFPV